MTYGLQGIATTSQTSEHRPIWRRVIDFVFGYDFFISYSWGDGGLYAEALARQLEAYSFEVFLDRKSYAAGDDWKKAGTWTLRRTGQLILVGSKGALISPAVLHEVQVFSGTGRRIIPIDFGGSLEWASAQAPLARYLPLEMLRVREPPGALAHGPSDGSVETIRRTFSLVRQDKTRVRVLIVVILVLTVLALASVYFAFSAQINAQRAQRELDRARMQLLATQARDADAEAGEPKRIELAAALAERFCCGQLIQRLSPSS